MAAPPETAESLQLMVGAHHHLEERPGDRRKRVSGALQPLELSADAGALPNPRYRPCRHTAGFTPDA
jgi:hypothetical protein